VALRPRPFAEVGDLTLAFLREHPRVFLALSPWVFVPALVAVRVVEAGEDPEEWWLRAIAAAFLPMLGAGAYVLACGELLLRRDVDIRWLNGRIVRGLLPAIGATVVAYAWTVVTVGLGFGMVTLLLPAVLLERAPILAAMRRSRLLMTYTPGRPVAFGVVVAVLPVSFVVGQVVIEAVAGLFGLPLPPGHELPWLLSIAKATAWSLAIVYASVLQFLLYVDNRTRAEGWDLQVELASLVDASARRVAGAS